MLRKLSVCASVLLLFVLSAGAEELSLNTIMSRVVEANGGEAALRNMRTVTVTGTMHIEGIDGAGEFTMWNAAPNKMHLKSTFSGFTSLMYCDGKRAWAASGSGAAVGEPQEMEQAQALSTIRSVTMNAIFLDFEKNGISLSLQPEEEVNGHKCYVVRYEYDDGQWVKAFYDAETFLPHQVESSTNPGKPFGMSDFRVVSGVQFPFVRTMTTANGLPLEMRVMDITVNAEVDESIFSPNK